MSPEIHQYILAVLAIACGGGGFLIARLINKTDSAAENRMAEFADQLEKLPEQFIKQLEKMQSQWAEQLKLTQSQFDRFAEKQIAQAERSGENANSMRQAIDRLNFTLDHQSKDGESKISALVTRIDVNSKEIDKLRLHNHDSANKMQSHELRIYQLEEANKVQHK